MASSDSSTSDGLDDIPLSQIRSPAAAAASTLTSSSLRHAMAPEVESNSDSDAAETSDEDAGYQPRPAQRSRNREANPDNTDSSDDSDSSSDKDKKPRAKSAKNSKTKTKKSKTPKGPTKEKCQGKGCPGLPPSEHRPMLQCGYQGCSKLVHRICYEKCTEKPSVARPPIPDKVFCTLGHHDKFVKTNTEMDLTWTNDGKEGPEDPKTSQYYLVNWLSTEENYQRYRDPPGALTKMKVCEEVASWIVSKGVRNKWRGDNVYNKINHIEQKMKSCHDGYAGTKTGHGVKESDPMGYEEKVRRIFPYYFDLEAVFCSRSGMIPMGRSDELFRKDRDRGCSQRTEDEEMMEELGGPEEAANTSLEEEDSSAVCSSVKKKQPQNKNRTRRRGRVLYPEDDQFNKLMKIMIEEGFPCGYGYAILTKKGSNIS